MSDDNKPREFWIVEQPDNPVTPNKLLSFNVKPPLTMISKSWPVYRVIEHSAYAALQKENQDLRRLNAELSTAGQRGVEMLAKQNASLRDQLKLAVEALTATTEIEDYYTQNRAYDLVEAALAKIKAKGEI